MRSRSTSTHAQLPLPPSRSRRASAAEARAAMAHLEASQAAPAWLRVAQQAAGTPCGVHTATHTAGTPHTVRARALRLPACYGQAACAARRQSALHAGGRHGAGCGRLCARHRHGVAGGRQLPRTRPTFTPWHAVIRRRAIRQCMYRVCRADCTALRARAGGQLIMHSIIGSMSLAPLYRWAPPEGPPRSAPYAGGPSREAARRRRQRLRP